jgi:osomolarity two-component system sensor histidine kinase NIK1
MPQIEEPALLDPEVLFAFLIAVRSGDFSQRLPTDLPGRWRDVAIHLNGFAAQMESTLADVTRVSDELAAGTFGGHVPNLLAPGPWRDCIESFNLMALALTGQVRDFAATASRLADGHPDRPATVPCQNETAGLKASLNRLVAVKSTNQG